MKCNNAHYTRIIKKANKFLVRYKGDFSEVEDASWVLIRYWHDCNTYLHINRTNKRPTSGMIAHCSNKDNILGCYPIFVTRKPLCIEE